jgi:ABC-2 type transport system ATP-binding protein
MAIFECRQLTKRYGSTTALDHIDLSLEPGRIVGLLGPNGSGKTTLIKLAARLLTPSSGQILIDGEVPGPETKAMISYLPDREFLPEYMNTRQLLNLYQDFYADFVPARAEEMLSSLDIRPNIPVRKLSKGTREKVRLILTMSRDAKVYMLDEPIAGVDPAARDYILKTIIGNYEPEALVLISTHLISDVESVLDEAVFLKEGHIVLHKSVDEIREEHGMSVDDYFRDVFRC